MKKRVISLMAAMLICCGANGLDAVQLFEHGNFDTSFGGLVRFRLTNVDNAFDLDEEGGVGDADFFRLKTSVWMKARWGEKWGGVVKFTNEARYFMENFTGDDGFKQDELLVDNLYLYVNGVFGLPVDLSIGRQDFGGQYGEGFLLMEGTPDDGSRTYYFNAARAVWHIAPGHSLDVVYISNPKDDVYLPSVYAADKRALNTSDEQGVVLYGRSKVSEWLSLEPYYMFKEEEAPAMAFGAAETDLDLHTLGARAVVRMGPYTLRGEYAGQFGEYDSGTEREAAGGYVFIGRKHPRLPWQPAWELGAVYVSGDDPSTTGKDEGFNPLFSRWPWLSELLVYSMIPERGVNYRTNLECYRAGLDLLCTNDTRLKLHYNYLRAPEDANSPFAVPGERDRGHLLQGRLMHCFSEAVSGYVLVEHMIAGDHYAAGDRATFVRWELQTTF